MKLYDTHIFPWLLDVACNLAPVRRQRQQLVPLALGFNYRGVAIPA